VFYVYGVIETPLPRIGLHRMLPLFQKSEFRSFCADYIWVQEALNQMIHLQLIPSVRNKLEAGKSIISASFNAHETLS